MSDTVIQVENVSKLYRLGEVGTGTLSHDFNRWWHKTRGKEDPYLKIGEANDRTVKGESDYVWALKDVNLEVKRGEILGIIGRNGAGKSTLLKILSRVTTPTSGQIKVKGRIASLLEVGTGFNPELTGRDNIYLNGSILGMRKREIDQKFDEIVAFAEVERYIDTPVKRYSSGMYVRLAFAVAAHLEPEILIVDEVLAVGDAEFQKKCLGKMHDVALMGRTVLFVSHQLGAVENLCNRGLLLGRGKVEFVGSQNDTIGRYLMAVAGTESGWVRRTDRGGSGEIKIVGFELRSLSGEILDSVISGQDIDIYIYFENVSMSTSQNVVAGIAVTTQLGSPVFLQHNRLMGKKIRAGRKGAFVCRVPKLPLPASIYSLSFSVVADDGTGCVIDMIENAALMPVLEGNYFGYGEVPPISHGVCLVEAKWRTENN